LWVCVTCGALQGGRNPHPTVGHRLCRDPLDEAWRHRRRVGAGSRRLRRGHHARGPLGRDEFITTQEGPTSTGLGWRLRVLNVSVTPYTYREPFLDRESILSHDTLKVGFEWSVSWRIGRAQVRDFVERFTALGPGTDPEKVVHVAYDNYIQQAIRTFARDEVQKYAGPQIKNNIDTIDAAIATRMNALLATAPFEIMAALVSEIRYPDVVENTVAQKIAATQFLEQKTTEIQITVTEAEKREKEAEGFAHAMATIKGSSRRNICNTRRSKPNWPWSPVPIIR
jgi:hypothetical protein